MLWSPPMRQRVSVAGGYRRGFTASQRTATNFPRENLNPRRLVMLSVHRLSVATIATIARRIGSGSVGQEATI